MSAPSLPSQILKLGLTGGIGSGKSTLARLLQGLGADLIDADAISRACTGIGGSAIPAIAQTFGSVFIGIDGSLDRQRMREHVFAQPDARKVLERIVHPLVGDEIRRQTAQATSSLVLFDIPLLVESPHWRPQLDRVLVVDCLPATQIRRVVQRSGWDLPTIEAVMRSQSTREKRLACADMVVFNDVDSIDNLQHLARALANRFGL